jgi:hypothetical protein
VSYFLKKLKLIFCSDIDNDRGLLSQDYRDIHFGAKLVVIHGKV